MLTANLSPVRTLRKVRYTTVLVNAEPSPQAEQMDTRNVELLQSTLPVLRARLAHSSSVAPLAGADDTALVARLRQLAHLKRLTECYLGDPPFRYLLETDTSLAPASIGIEASRDDIETFLAIQRAGPRERYDDLMTENLVLLRDLAVVAGNWEGLERRASTGAGAYAAWRRRQRARERFELAPNADDLFRPPAAIELSSGCSVGCWFCGISAPRLGALFVYTPAHARLWRGVLRGLEGVLGEATGTAICYWATDPFDNPDYERLIAEFAQCTGMYPVTLTALAHRQPERTRELLATSARHGCLSNQLSVLSRSALHRLHANIAPEELLFAPLVQQQPEALHYSVYPYAEKTFKVNAGRARERRVSARQGPQVQAHDGTIACVVGFLVNMVERRIRLVTPCPASSRWPLGYVVYAERRFAGVEDFAWSLEAMVAEQMRADVPLECRLRFQPSLHYRAVYDGFVLAGRWHSESFRPLIQLPGGVNWLALGERIRAERESGASIIASFEARGVRAEATLAALQRLWEAGVLAEEQSEARHEAGLH